MSLKRAMSLPHVVWQGMPGDIDDMYHLLKDYAGDEFSEVNIARGVSDDSMLLVQLSAEEHFVLHIGDQIMLDNDDESDTARIGVLRAEQVGNA